MGIQWKNTSLEDVVLVQTSVYIYTNLSNLNCIYAVRPIALEPQRTNRRLNQEEKMTQSGDSIIYGCRRLLLAPHDIMFHRSRKSTL